MKQPYFETPPKITVSITATCNLDCETCYADCNRRPKRKELTTQEWLAFIEYLVENGFIQIYFEGGEPLHRPDFDTLLQSCCRRMMTLVRTHGTLIDRARARKLKRLGVGRLFVDLMGASAGVHDAAARTPGSFARSCAGVRNAVEAGLPTDVVLILTRHNVDELQAYLELAHALGAQRAGILRLYPLGRARHRWSELALSLEEQEEALAAVRPPPGLAVMRSWHPNDANCCWQAAAVDPFGRSIGCMYLREYVDFGDVRETPFLETWHGNALYKALRAGTVESSCEHCESNEGTRGGCRSTAYAFTGRWTAPDPFCSHSNGGIDLRVLPKRLLRGDAEPEAPPDPGDGSVRGVHAR
ncbi:MAG TPA: radical SAM protein [Burkholderiales bacterium]|nr:radical SAM protein [Burkholderiales bacterium]